MEMKKLHMGTVAFGWDSMDEVGHLLAQTFRSFGDISSPSECPVDCVDSELRILTSR